jgi:hypothetical protein
MPSGQRAGGAGWWRVSIAARPQVIAQLSCAIEYSSGTRSRDSPLSGVRVPEHGTSRVARPGARVARLDARVWHGSASLVWHGSWHGRPGNASTASAVSAIFRVIGAGSALSARGRTYGKEKVYGSIP